MTDQPTSRCVDCGHVGPTYSRRRCTRCGGPAKPSTPAPSGGDALTDDEKALFDARLAGFVAGFHAARAAQPPTPTAVEALAADWQAQVEDTAGATVVIDLEDALARLRAALADGAPDIGQAWDEGHRAGCSYFPDCVTLGHHDGNPYRGAALPEPSGGVTVTEWGADNLSPAQTLDEWAKRAGFTVYPWQRAWFDDTVGAQDRAAALAQVEAQTSEPIDVDRLNREHPLDGR
jgi:hypothetical protein